MRCESNLRARASLFWNLIKRVTDVFNVRFDEARMIIESAQFLNLDLSAFPLVARLVERCFAIPAFAASHPFEQPGFKALSAQ